MHSAYYCGLSAMPIVGQGEVAACMQHPRFSSAIPGPSSLKSPVACSRETHAQTWPVSARNCIACYTPRQQNNPQRINAEVGAAMYLTNISCEHRNYA